MGPYGKHQLSNNKIIKIGSPSRVVRLTKKNYRSIENLLLKSVKNIVIALHISHTLVYISFLKAIKPSVNESKKMRLVKISISIFY